MSDNLTTFLPPQLAYYFAQQSGAKPLNEAKLILVGRGDVGKTSVSKALMTGDFNQGMCTPPIILPHRSCWS